MGYKSWTEGLIQNALEDVGVREIGSNDGPRIREILATIGLIRAPYCAAAGYAWGQETSDEMGVKNPMIRTGYCPYVQRDAKARGILSLDKAKRGDGFVMISSPEGYPRAAHYGVIEDVVGNNLHTIEANTNLDGSREGNGIYQRTRIKSSRFQFIAYDKVAPKTAGTPITAKPIKMPDVPEFAPSNGYHLFLSGRDIGIAAFSPQVKNLTLYPVRQWCEKLGVECDWDYELQLVRIQRKEAPLDLYRFGGLAYAPIRQLVKFSGLQLEFKQEKRQILVTRKK